MKGIIVQVLNLHNQLHTKKKKKTISLKQIIIIKMGIIFTWESNLTKLFHIFLFFFNKFLFNCMIIKQS